MISTTDVQMIVQTIAEAESVTVSAVKKKNSENDEDEKE